MGSEAPHFTRTVNDLSDWRCEAYHGKIPVLSVFPSRDTPVCAAQTRTFTQRATQRAKDVIVLRRWLRWLGVPRRELEDRVKC